MLFLEFEYAAFGRSLLRLLRRYASQQGYSRYISISGPPTIRHQSAIQDTLARRTGYPTDFDFCGPFYGLFKVGHSLFLSPSRFVFFFKSSGWAAMGQETTLQSEGQRKGDAADGKNRGIKSILVRSQKASIVHASSFIGPWLRNEVIWVDATNWA